MSAKHVYLAVDAANLAYSLEPGERLDFGALLQFARGQGAVMEAAIYLAPARGIERDRGFLIDLKYMGYTRVVYRDAAPTPQRPAEVGCRYCAGDRSVGCGAAEAAGYGGAGLGRQRFSADRRAPDRARRRGCGGGAEQGDGLGADRRRTQSEAQASSVSGPIFAAPQVAIPLMGEALPA